MGRGNRGAKAMSGSLSSRVIKGTFLTSAKTKPDQKKRNSPISIRFSEEERALLKKRAGSKCLSAYVRHRALDGDVTPRKTGGHTPVKDHQALAHVLSALGRSEIHKSLNSIIALSKEGETPFDDRIQKALWRACSDIAEMRTDLVAALGLRGKEPSL
jgi:Mobilization protein NikA